MKGLKIVPIIMVLLLYAGCIKDQNLKCEVWEVRDACVVTDPTYIDWRCSGSRTLQLAFCGASLNDAKAGNTIILRQDEHEKKTRTFIRFVRNF